MNNDVTIAASCRLLLTFLLAAACLTAKAQVGDANPPEKMTYQGYLVDAGGTPLGNSGAKNYLVVFRIYDEQNGGTCLWAEQQTVTVSQGYFSVLLGEGSSVGDPRPALSTVFTGARASERYIGITVNLGSSTVDIAPRLKLVASPFAYLAKSATALVNETGQPLAAMGGTNLQVSGSISANNFNGFGTIPLGGIIMWSGSEASVPAGWALCNGQSVNGRPTPDLRGRFVLGSGAGAGLLPRTPNQVGGEETHKLTVTEMPAHTHKSSFTQAEGNDCCGGWFETSWGGSTTGWIESTGGDQPHNTMPPFYVLAFIMRVQ